MVGEVVRLYAVNTANTRIFNFAVRGARVKLIRGDSGRYERETFVEKVLLAPSERAISTCSSTPPVGCDSGIELRTGSATSGPSLFRRPREAPGRGDVRGLAHRADRQNLQSPEMQRIAKRYAEVAEVSGLARTVDQAVKAREIRCLRVCLKPGMSASEHDQRLIALQHCECVP